MFDQSAKQSVILRWIIQQFVQRVLLVVGENVKWKTG